MKQPVSFFHNPRFIQGSEEPEDAPSKLSSEDLHRLCGQRAARAYQQEHEDQ